MYIARPKKKITQKKVYFGSVYNMSAFLFVTCQLKIRPIKKQFTLDLPPQLINTTTVIGTHDINRELSV
jgi:hypothetical protein